MPLLLRIATPARSCRVGPSRLEGSRRRGNSGCEGPPTALESMAKARRQAPGDAAVSRRRRSPARCPARMGRILIRGERDRRSFRTCADQARTPSVSPHRSCAPPQKCACQSAQSQRSLPWHRAPPIFPNSTRSDCARSPARRHLHVAVVGKRPFGLPVGLAPSLPLVSRRLAHWPLPPRPGGRGPRAGACGRPVRVCPTAASTADRPTAGERRGSLIRAAERAARGP
jgi:hypothetical protein